MRVRKKISNCNNTECYICLELISSNEKCGKITCCHKFHHHCLQQWLNSPNNHTGNKCPVCLVGIISPEKKNLCIML